MKNNSKAIIYLSNTCIGQFIWQVVPDDQTTRRLQLKIPLAPSAKLSDIQAKIFNSCAEASCHSAATHQANYP